MAQLRTQGDIIAAFLVRMNTSSTYGFYTDAILTTMASEAQQWCAALYKWPMTEGRYSTTFASLSTNEDGYTTLEYPEGFRSDSIRLLTVGGKRFYKKNFYKFQEFIEDNPQDSSKIYTDFARRVFVNPRASDLSGTVVAWGQYNPAALGTDTITGGAVGPDPSATTIFSDIENDANEAIVEKMMADALTRQKTSSSMSKDGEATSAALEHEQKAMKILAKVWERIKGEQYAYQDTQNDGMFKRFDVLRGGFKEDLFNRDQW